MPEEDQPPEEIYGDDEALKEWFQAVKERHANPSGPAEPLEEVPMWTNEAR